MATWAIGDVHGCFRTLEALIDRIGLDQERDRLWMVGDLVNRGPRSLQVLRWARDRDRELGERFQIVLGNHDLHLIARGLGVATPRAGDTLDQVLEAPDGRDLIDWLRQRPFIHFGRIGGSDFVLVHAGLLPGWSAQDALQAGKRLQRQLQGPDATHLLRRRSKDECSRDEAAPEARKKPSPAWNSAAASRVALAAFTRMRMLDSNARPHAYNGPPEQAPKRLRPWFEVEPRGCPGHTVVCGHWAALGLRLVTVLVALDTGCVWGGRLTAVRLDDRRITQEKVVDRL